MNFIKKLLKDDDDELYDDKYKDDYSDKIAGKKGVAAAAGAMGDMSDMIDDIPPADAGEPASRPGVGVSGNGAAVSLRVMKPKSYDDGPEIADYIAGGCTVVMNIEDLSRENSRRLIDFLLGAVHVLGGDLQMASQNTFVVAPCSVGVGGDEEGEGEGDGLDSPAGYAGISDFAVADKAKASGNRAAGGFGFNK